MTKQEFIFELYKKLKNFPKKEVDESIAFYSEIIDDNIEDGLTEEQAVSKLGSVDDIVNQIASQIPLTKIVKQNAKPTRTLKTWELVLLIATSPIWFSLIVGLFAVAFSVYAVLWSVVVTFWAVAGSFCVAGPLGAIFGIIIAFIKGAEGVAIIGACLVLAGVGIMLVFLSKLLTKLLVAFTKLLSLALKKAFANRGNNNEINY